MTKKVIKMVEQYAESLLDKSDQKQEFEVFVVWQCYILGNTKWLLSTTLPDGMYYKEEMRLHETFICEIVERQQATLRELNKWKHDVLGTIADAKQETDSVMRKAGRDEQIRYKMACMAIENERQQLFADYKAQGADVETNGE